MTSLTPVDSCEDEGFHIGSSPNPNPIIWGPFFFADPASSPLLVTVAVLVDELDEVRVVVRGGGEREAEDTARTEC